MNDFRTFSIGVLVLAMFAQTASAADETFGAEVTPFGAYRFGGQFDVKQSDEFYELDDAESFGVILNLPHSENTQYEVFYSQQHTKAVFSGAAANEPAVDLDMHVLQLGGTYQGEGETLRPYLAATIGGTHIKTRSAGSKSDTFFSGSIGVGLLFQPHSRLGLRLEARAYGTLTDPNTELFCQTGPDLSLCAVRIDGKLLAQIETFAGVVFRF
jgi:hypothetical protein